MRVVAGSGSRGGTVSVAARRIPGGVERPHDNYVISIRPMASQTRLQSDRYQRSTVDADSFDEERSLCPECLAAEQEQTETPKEELEPEEQRSDSVIPEPQAPKEPEHELCPAEHALPQPVSTLTTD